MANLQDYYNTGVGNAANNPAPGAASGAAKVAGPASGTDLAKNVVIAWGITFGVLTGLNFLIRKFG